MWRLSPDADHESRRHWNFPPRSVPNGKLTYFHQVSGFVRADTN